MNKDLYQDDSRDQTIYIEYFPKYTIKSVWWNNGKLDYWTFWDA